MRIKEEIGTSLSRVSDYSGFFFNYEGALEVEHELEIDDLSHHGLPDIEILLAARKPVNQEVALRELIGEKIHERIR